MVLAVPFSAPIAPGSRFGVLHLGRAGGILDETELELLLDLETGSERLDAALLRAGSAALSLTERIAMDGNGGVSAIQFAHAARANCAENTM